MAQITRTVTRALQHRLDLLAQVVDFGHQRRQFLRHLLVQLPALPAAPLRQLALNLAQRPERAAQKPVLQRRSQQHYQHAEPAQPPAGPTKLNQQRLIIDGHTDGQPLTALEVLAGPDQ